MRRAGALEWAITYARQTGAVPDIVTAWMFPMAIGHAFTTRVDEVRQRSLDLLDGAIRHVTEVGPDVVVRSEASEQPAGPALVTAGIGTNLSVLGWRGMGGCEEFQVGSVGH
jgi:hypothetical protein